MGRDGGGERDGEREREKRPEKVGGGGARTEKGGELGWGEGVGIKLVSSSSFG